MRFFSQIAKVGCRGYSLPLQRRIVDFAADVSFGEASKKLQEHYSIEIGESAIRNITEAHAQNMHVKELQQCRVNKLAHKYLISETDGCMLPIVYIEEAENGDDDKDKRKRRKTCWKECKLVFCQKKGSIEKYFGATLDSSEEVGKLLQKTATKVGYNQRTRIHAIGDGAQWIIKQYQQVFGDKVEYLVDFYHVCEYIAEASKYFEKSEKWRKEQQELLKQNRADLLIEILKDKIQTEEIEEPEHAIVKCLRYIENRKTQLNYAKAIREELPIGSGAIESSNRSVIQKRLKITGAWWLHENCKKMLSLRIVRANNDWEEYWNEQQIKAA